MKAYLMYRGADFDPEQDPPSNAEILTQDLELETLLAAMAGEDEFAYGVARRAILCACGNDMDTVRYRQAILKDCLRQSAIAHRLYDIAVEFIAAERKVHWGFLSRYPSAILNRSIEVVGLSLDMLKELRDIAEKHAADFDSEGFARFFEMLRKELTDEYFDIIREHLKTLSFNNGTLISAALGKGNKGIDYRLRIAPELKLNWLERVERAFAKKPPSYGFSIPPRDENGARALSELNDRGINLVANALAQSADHILDFFKMLRTELAFYMACLNLHERLRRLGKPICFPEPRGAETRAHAAKGLYDPCLALTMDKTVIANDLEADGKDLVVITGANRGGKSVFLRAVGVSQLMMQCGMFAPAKSLRANLCVGIFTHYKREEDTTMRSGKLDEELSRMSDIVDAIKPNAMVLFNESFAATNEIEGSEIARNIATALVERQVKLLFVTHMYDFAHGLYALRMNNALFLRAERLPDGRRTFKLNEKEPLQTSFGKDVFNKVFKQHA